MVDADLVRRKLALDLYVSQLSEYRLPTADEYRHDWNTQGIVDRTFQIAVEACTDVATHAIADRGLRVPATYAEAFEVLGETGLLDHPSTDALVRLAGFRNVLVHEYARLNPEIVVDALRNRLGDFGRFRELPSAGSDS